MSVPASRPSRRTAASAERDNAARPPIRLHIEELVLHGFSPHDRHHIGEAMETELHRLLTEQGFAGWQPQDLTMERMDAGEFRAAPGARAGSLGAQVAQSVFRASSSGLSTRRETQ